MNLDICLHDFGGRAPEFDGLIELCCVERRGLGSRRVAVEASNAPHTIEKARCGQSTSCLADHECCDQRTGGGGIFIYQAFQRDRELVDRIGRREMQSLGKSLISDGSCLPDNSAEMFPDA